MIYEGLAAAFSPGVAAGQSAASDLATQFQSEFGDQLQLLPEIEGETLEKTQERFREQFEDFFRNTCCIRCQRLSLAWVSHSPNKRIRPISLLLKTLCDSVPLDVARS